MSDDLKAQADALLARCLDEITAWEDGFPDYATDDETLTDEIRAHLWPNTTEHSRDRE